MSKKIGKARKVMKLIMVAFLILCFWSIVIIGILRIRNANKSKINTDNGIQENIYVEIGGIEQYLQIRGEDKDNPVILWLHGGPGFPLTYLSYYYQTGLEDDYTIVCWEQRGCGRTYYRNEPTEDVSVDILLSDMDELIDYLRERFGEERIIIIGQSWGTVLGIEYINIHPEKIAAYIGVGQVTNFAQGKVYAGESAVYKATTVGNNADAEMLRQYIEQFGEADNLGNMNIKTLESLILKSLEYLKSDSELSGISQMLLGITSPEMSLNDARWFMFAGSTSNIFASQNLLVDYMYFKFDVNNFKYEYDLPICFIQGSHDWITPTDLVEDYYKKVIDANKGFVIIDNAGHTPFLDNPGEFCKEIKQFLESIGDSIYKN